MSIQRTVNEFVSKGKDLYHRLRSEGDALSDVELVALREQLHILDAEAGRLQDCKEFESDGIAFIFNSKRQHAAKQLSRKH